MTTPRELLAQYTTQSQLSSFFIDRAGYIFVSSYGAVGDGTTDDTVSVQAAIAASIAAGKTEVHFVGGKTYLVNTLVNTSGITFIGDNVTITGTSGIDVISFSSYLAKSTYYVSGADNTGVTDSTTLIQSFINNTPTNGTLRLPRGTFYITGLTINKAMTFEGDSKLTTILKIVGTGNGIHINGPERVTIRDLCVFGNGSASYGSDSISGYGIYCNGARAVLIENVWFKYLGNHALYLEGGCWSYNITRCDFDSIKGDAINCIARNSLEQKNAININGCNISFTNESGVNVWGININIENCVIQSTNVAGIEISSDNVTGNYGALKTVIKKNYFEACKSGGIYVKGELIGGDTRYVDDLNIEDNYIALTASQANVGINALVQCVSNGSISSPTIRRLNIKGNSYTTDTLAYVDGANKLSSNSTITMAESSLYTKIINPGLAKLVNSPRGLVLPGYLFAKGQNYTNLEYSDLITVNTSVYFPLPLPINAQFINMGMYIYTDYSAYQVVFSLFRRNRLSVDSYVEAVFSAHNDSGAKYIESTSVYAISQAAVDAARIKSDYEYIVRVRVYPTTPGTYFRIGSLNINYVE